MLNPSDPGARLLDILFNASVSSSSDNGVLKQVFELDDSVLNLVVLKYDSVSSRVEKNPGFYTKNPITLGFWQKPWVFVGFWVFGLDHRCWCRKAVGQEHFGSVS